MTTLTEFLLARIADQERLARDMAFQAASGRPLLTLNGGGTLIRELVDPARVLAECDAKRRIVRLADDFLREQVEARDASGMGAALMHRDVLRLLALPYADHPDYDETWRP